jgi:hypothetical protein
MPAKSKAQQRFMGMVHAAQKGELDNPSSEVEKVADSMSDADAKDYASTKHKGLPNHVKKENMEKQLKEIIRQTYRESLRESVNEDATELPQATIPSAVKVKLQMAIDKIKDSKLSNNAKLQLVAQVIDALDVDKSQLSNIANKIRSKMESVNEAKIQPKDDWGVRLVVAINNNVAALHTSVIREKKDVQQAVAAFGNVLKNAIKETLKHKYKPHPKYTEADSKIKTFISELKKFENIVDMVISKPTKSGIVKLDDAWRNIWNHKYGAAIALSGDLFNSIIENESVNEAKYPTNLYVGSIIYGQGFTGLKGIEGGKYYKVVEMDDTTATLAPCDQKGKITGSKKVRHKLDSIEGGIKTAKRGDENGIVIESVIVEDIKSDINKFLDKLNKQFPEQEYTTDFKGGKYARIVQQNRKYSGNRSAWGFVAMEDNPSKGFKKGDLLKAAGFNTPAKGARGNILDGTAKYDKYSPVYLRESVNESISHEAMGIASMTNTRKEAVQKFIDDNNLNAKEILTHVTKGKLPERIRFVQALVGTPNNSSFKWYVKNYTNESVVTEGKKAFKINPPIGKAKYSISAHNGVSKHKDGSDFWDILIFKNKADLERRAKYFRGEKYIEESVIKEGVYKSILSNNKGKLFFSLVDDETDKVTDVDAKAWLKSTIKDKSSDNSKELVLSALVRQINQFNKKVDFNMWVNANKPTWEEKVKYLFDKGLANNVNKTGIKVH